jgi:hypothetical protein
VHDACTNATCSDGFVQAGEECDEGADNSDNARARRLQAQRVRRRHRCTTRGGGDEECDNGADNGPGKACNAMCELNVCGDGDKGPDEECDDGQQRPAGTAARRLQARAVRQRDRRPGRGAATTGSNGDNDDGCTDLCKRRCAATASCSRARASSATRAGQQQRGGVHAGLQERGVRRRPDPAKRGAVRRRGQQRPGQGVQGELQQERVRRRVQGAGRGVRRRQPEQRRRVHERVQAGDLRRRLQAAGGGVRPRGQQQQHGRVHAGVQAAVCGDVFVQMGPRVRRRQPEQHGRVPEHLQAGEACGDGFTQQGVEACDDGNQSNTTRA